MKTALLSSVLSVLGPAFATEHNTPVGLDLFFREQIGLSATQIARLARGEVITKALPSDRPADVLIFGAVLVASAPSNYLKYSSDLDRLRRLPGYLSAVRFSNPPVLADLQEFTLEPHDIASLRNCRPGKCALQLPAESIMALRQSLTDSNDPAFANTANARIQKITLALLRQYREVGNRALGTYHDDAQNFPVEAGLRSWLEGRNVLPTYLPDLSRFLLGYPHLTLVNSESWFYWEKVAFGLKPTLRLNHAVAYRALGPRGDAQIVAIKQLYASHYFQLALDITECIPVQLPDGREGFYLISLRGSSQRGLTGWTGAIMRRIILSRAQSAQQKALTAIQRELQAW